MSFLCNYFTAKTCVRFVELSGCLVALVMFLHDVGAGEWFTWHPVFMTLGFLFFMTEGILTYYRGVAARENKASSRRTHMRFQGLGFVCVLLGFISIWRSHQLMGHENWPDDDHPVIVRYHMYIGYLVCLLVVLQVLVGLSKYFCVGARLKWHGKIGPWIWWAGMLNIIIGAIFWHGKLIGLRVLLSALVVCVMGVVAFYFRKVQVLRANDRYSEVVGSTEIVDMLDDVDLGGLEQTHLGSKYKDVLDNEDFDKVIMSGSIPYFL